MSREREYGEVEARVKADGQNAVLLTFSNGFDADDNEIFIDRWIPYSLIEQNPDLPDRFRVGCMHRLFIESWKLDQEEISY